MILDGGEKKEQLLSLAAALGGNIGNPISPWNLRYIVEVHRRRRRGMSRTETTYERRFYWKTEIRSECVGAAR